MLRRRETRLAGLVLLQPESFADDRGYFLESYSRRDLEQLEITTEFVQDNHSRSVRDTVRGLHFQTGRGQAKLVRAARGRVWDVAVDIRADSPTFGEWEGFELDDVEHWQLYLPVGFAHGFCAISEVADVSYKVSAYYDPAAERGIAWDDPGIGISWPTTEPMLSDRDRRNPPLAEALL